MLRLTADLGWRIDGPEGAPLDPRVLELLRALKDESTLRAAAGHAGLSYRAAWGLLLDAAKRLGEPLVELQRGRGARLTRLGAILLREDAELRRALAPLAERHAVTPRGAAEAGVPLRLAASHDPLLAEFCERFARPAGLVASVAFRGSEEALALYARGGCDLAGFHIEEGLRLPGIRRFIRPRDRLVRFARREQGLIVAHGNPRGLRGLADVARKRARFVNRQAGSGTRALVDRLLAEAGIPAGQIAGYATEEYTHLAVAATIAAGRADAGFGVRAAAAQLGLDFIPVVHERYWLVASEATLAGAPGRRLLEGLGGKPLARLARALAGYELEGSGEVLRPEEAAL